MRLPQIRRISASDFATKVLPFERTAPQTIRAAGGSQRGIESASVVLPEPTTPSVSPAPSVSETSSTARKET